MFDAMAQSGCFFFIPAMFRGQVASNMESYQHGHQFVFDERALTIVVVDAVSGEARGEVINLGRTPAAGGVEEN